MLKGKAPCKVCPYKLGIMKALVSPCPMCKLNGYKTYANLKEKYDNRTERKCL